MNLFNGRLPYTPSAHRNKCESQERYCEMIGEHDYEVKSETIGDYGVVNGTATNHWYECCICGHVSDKQVDYQDFHYDDDYF